MLKRLSQRAGWGLAALFSALLPVSALAEEGKLDTGDTAFIIICSAMVLLMTPGLALFYGGMVRKKNVLSTMMKSYFMMGLVTVQWILIGYSIAFSPSEGSYLNNLFGGFQWAGFAGITASSMSGTIPQYVFAVFQGMFAIITVAIISGAVAERIKFSAFVAFALLWTTLVYDPVCRWVWGPDGFLGADGALDFAGGTVVHIISGVSGLVAASMLGARKGIESEDMLPHNMTMVLLGTGLLWFGWFAFNAGSALAADGTAGLAFINTNTAAGAAALSWALLEWARNGKPSGLGVASGAVAGLVVITPAAGFVSPGGALWMGLLVSPICYWAVFMKTKLGYDDSLDAFGIHGVGGTVGALLVAFFALDVTDTAHQFAVQGKAVVITALYSAIMTFVLIKIVGAVFGERVSRRDEELGLDITQHGEAGYEV